MLNPVTLLNPFSVTEPGSGWGPPWPPRVSPRSKWPLFLQEYTFWVLSQNITLILSAIYFSCFISYKITFSYHFSRSRLNFSAPEASSPIKISLVFQTWNSPPQETFHRWSWSRFLLFSLTFHLWSILSAPISNVSRIPWPLTITIILSCAKPPSLSPGWLQYLLTGFPAPALSPGGV